MSIISKNFATTRGFVRTILADLMWRAGPYKKYGRVNWDNVQRLVFICQGNICRSPFAHYLTSSLEPGIPVTSFGLATTTGVEAFSLATDVAGDYRLDMSHHTATDLVDFNIKDGDLLIVMEDRHINKLKPKLHSKNVQLCLLGLWCRPRFALLYDPFEHDRIYFESCFSRIDRAVNNMLLEYKTAKTNQSD